MFTWHKIIATSRDFFPSLKLFHTFLYYFLDSKANWYFAEILNCVKTSFIPKTLSWLGRGNAWHFLSRPMMMSYIWLGRDNRSSPFEPLTLKVYRPACALVWTLARPSKDIYFQQRAPTFLKFFLSSNLTESKFKPPGKLSGNILEQLFIACGLYYFY